MIAAITYDLIYAVPIGSLPPPSRLGHSPPSTLWPPAHSPRHSCLKTKFISLSSYCLSNSTGNHSNHLPSHPAHTFPSSITHPGCYLLYSAFLSTIQQVSCLSLLGHNLLDYVMLNNLNGICKKRVLCSRSSLNTFFLSGIEHAGHHPPNVQHIEGKSKTKHPYPQQYSQNL